MYDLKLENISLSDERVAFVEAKPVGWSDYLPVSRLFGALQHCNVPESVWPPIPSPHRCLERAVHSLKGPRSLIRPLAKIKGWSLVLEDTAHLDKDTEEDGVSSHTVDLTCKLDKEGDSITLKITPSNHPAADHIRKEFERHQEGLFKCSQDLSQWFSRVIIPWCAGVPTRARGGSYYIMKGEPLDKVRKVAKALDLASRISNSPLKVGDFMINRQTVMQGGKIILKPEIASVQAIEIVIDNLVAECDRVCDQIEEDIHTDLGKRALASRRQQTRETLNKLSTYEKLLDTNLVDVRERLNELQNGIGVMELQQL